MKKYKNFIAMGLALIFLVVPTNVQAQEDTDMEVRSEEEVNELLCTYKRLFPEDYHFIETYLEEGIDTSVEEPQLVIEKSVSDYDADYTLIVYDNNQVLTIESREEIMYSIQALGDTVRHTGVYTLGDLGHYKDFTGVYNISKSSYDSIVSFKPMEGAGHGDFLIPSIHKSIKEKEDASGAAYIAYQNCYITLYGTTYFYDFGLAVGRNQAKPVVQLAKGWDAFLYRLINIFN